MKAADVKDSSLRVPSGTKGTVIDVQVFTRDGLEKDDRALAIEKAQLDSYRKDLKEEYKIFEEAARERVIRLLKGQESNGGGSTKRGDKLSEDLLSGLELVDLLEIQPADEAIAERLTQIQVFLKRRAQKSMRNSLRRNVSLQQVMN